MAISDSGQGPKRRACTKLYGAGSRAASLFVVAALMGASLTAVSPAHGNDNVARAAARDLGYEGVQAYQAGDFDLATEKLEMAYSALQVPSLALWSARALDKSGRLMEAAERYLDATRAEVAKGGDGDVQLAAQKEAKAERAALLPRIPKLTILIEGAEPSAVRVSINGTEIVSALIGSALSSNPGEVTVSGQAGELWASESRVLEEGSSIEVTLKFETPAVIPPPAAVVQGSAAKDPSADQVEDQGASSNWQPLAGWIGVGSGAALLVMGGVTGGLAQSQYKGLGCEDDGQCPLSVTYDEMKSVNTLRTLSTVGFVAGGVLAAAGVTLLLTAPKSENVAYVSPYVGLTSAGFKGAF